VDTGGSESIGFIIFSSETQNIDQAIWATNDLVVLSMVVEDDSTSNFDITYTVVDYASDSEDRQEHGSGGSTCL
jgi:hypothetical protein